MTAYPKRLIEVDLPIKQISAHARREKSIRHGHISTLHIWWARRPLAACRAVICAALWPDPADSLCPQDFRDKAASIINDFAEKAAKDEDLANHCSTENWSKWKTLAKAENKLDSNNPNHLNVLRFRLLDFIADFANWDNSKQANYLETSRALTQAAHEALGGIPGTKPLVVDPFAGGGSIPLEALRVGADAFASDLNPVAVLLNKVVLEYIPKYGQKLADEVRKWGEWVKKEAEKELAEFYPIDADGSTPIAYLWARTILSEAPGQNEIPVEIPLFRSMWLVKKKGRNQALRWVSDSKGQVKTQIVEVTYADGITRKVQRPLLEIFQPNSAADVGKGTSKGGTATCPVTGYTTSVENVRQQLSQRFGGSSDARLLCVVTLKPDALGRFYRLSNEQDLYAAENATIELMRQKQLHINNSVALVPDEELNHLRGFFNVILYGMNTWGNLFSSRQLLALITLTRLVNQIKEELTEYDEGLLTAIQTCLGLAVSRHADINASLGMWHNTRELITHVFGRQALPMVWDFAEANSFCNASGSFTGGIDWIARVLEQIIPTVGQVVQASATAHPLPDDAAEIIFTDPPYYSAIPYADLSDFFYSWLKRSLKNVHSDLFSSKLTPKDDECVSLSHRAAMYRQKDSTWFESMMSLACRESFRVGKPYGIGIFVFANKETSGWEAMLTALINSGWTITGSWPIDTEMGNRLRARNSAALASSVHLVCRPRNKEEIGDWRDILQELPQRIHDWMPRLATEGVVGADAIFACLGPALEIFSRYSSVEKASGEIVTLKEYLEYVWAAVSKEALSMIFSDADVTGFEEDARLTAMWLWTLSTGTETTGESEVGEEETEEEEETSGKTAKISGYILEFDAARKIAQGLGAHLEKLTTLVQVKGDKARLLPVKERSSYLFDKNSGQAATKTKKKTAKNPILPGMESYFPNSEETEETGGSWGDTNVENLGKTVLDRIHQSMILFASGRSEALKRFLVDEGVGSDQRFWKLAQAFSALYPNSSEEKRWVDGVLARKKGLGF